MDEPVSRTREMTSDDVAALASLWVESWSRAMPELDFEARRAWLAEHLATLKREGASIRVWPAEGDPLGFVTIHPMTGYIDQLAVGVSAWGTDVAPGLIAEAERISPERLELLVNKDNPRAVRFYEKNGFVKLGETFSERTGLPLWKMVREPAEPAP